eukprot:2508084-Pyramimonas_sp.AAC.1
MQNECTRVLLRDIQQYITALHADFEAEAFCCSKIAATVAQLLSFKARADACAKKVISDVRSANASSWKDWVDKALDKGAKAAHKFIKERTKWEPDTVVIE